MHSGPRSAHTRQTGADNKPPGSAALTPYPMTPVDSLPNRFLSGLNVRRNAARLAARLILSAQIAAIGTPSFADTPPVPFRVVAASGMPAPGGGTFDRFHLEGQPTITPVNDRGQVAFFATLARARASEGLFLGDVHGIQAIALRGGPVPGGGKLDSFSNHPVPAINRSGAVAFTASIAEGKASQGVFLSSKQKLRVIALSGGAAASSTGGTFTEFHVPVVNDSEDVAFLAEVKRGRDTLEGIYLNRAGILRRIAAAGDAAPGGGTYAAFGGPTINNNGEVAFAASIEGGAVNGGIFVASAKETRMLVGAGNPEPSGGIFSQFSDRISINSTGGVLFNAVLKLGPAGHGLFVSENDKVRLVASVGRETPTAADFTALGQWPSLSDDGTVGFIAADASGTPGLYLATARRIKRRAIVGDALADGSKLASFPLYPAVTSSPHGTLAFEVHGESAGKNFDAVLVAAPPHD